MSSVFNSHFAASRAPVSAPRRPHRASLLRQLVGWLGLVRSGHKAAPAQRRSPVQQTHLMLQAGEQMLARSHTDKQPLSIAVFDLNDLPELETVFGPQVAREVMAQVVLKLQGMAGTRGVVIRTDATVFTVLMPGFGRDRAHQAIERTMGSPCCIELDAGDHEIVLVPDFKVHTMRPDSGPLGDVYARLRRDIASGQHLEQRRQRYLQLERESHTRPMELSGSADSGSMGARQPDYRPAAATVPMPIKA